MKKAYARIWRSKISLLWPFLAPLSLIYRCAFWIRKASQKPQSVGLPVICIGNLTLGGNGKTPLTCALADHMNAYEFSTHILTRGYKRPQGPVQEPFLAGQKTTHAYSGDEALLLSCHAPTWVGGNRYESACAAKKKGAQLLIMDDGFQNFSLKKDLSIIMLDATSGVGNGALLPLGPLRESLSSALKRLDALVVVDFENAPPKQKKKVEKIMARVRRDKKPVFNATRSLLRKEKLLKKRLVIFEGLGGVPGRFRRALEREGFGHAICAAYTFGDHHVWSEKEAKFLLKEARKHNALLVTTEKNKVSLMHAPEKSACEALYNRCFSLGLTIGIEEWDIFEALIAHTLQRLEDENPSNENMYDESASNESMLAER